MKQWAFSCRSRAVTAKKCTKKRDARAFLFCSTKLLLVWRSRHRVRRTMHLKLPYTCGSRLLHGGYFWKVIDFIVAILSFPERKTSNRGSESYLVPIMWTKYLSVLTIISTRQCKHFRPHSFSKLRRNTQVGLFCESRITFLSGTLDGAPANFLIAKYT